MWAVNSSTCAWVIGSPSAISALARDTHSLRQVWYLVSGEKRPSIYSEAYLDDKGDSYRFVMLILLFIG